MRVPILVGHSEAVWIETEEPLAAEHARELLEAAPGVRVDDFPSPGKAAGIDDVLVGRIRPDRSAGENALTLWNIARALSAAPTVTLLGSIVFGSLLVGPKHVVPVVLRKGLTGLISSRGGLTPFWGRFMEIAEGFVLLTLVPLALAVFDVYATARSMTG